jgi:hypothetical protein
MLASSLPVAITPPVDADRVPREPDRRRASWLLFVPVSFLLRRWGPAEAGDYFVCT